jgi:hypothetical protein
MVVHSRLTLSPVVSAFSIDPLLMNGLRWLAIGFPG